MAITTSESFGAAKPRVCDVCGHAPGLLRQRVDLKWVCEGGCPPEPAPKPEGALIAHDPLSDGMGASRKALERLRELGH